MPCLFLILLPVSFNAKWPIRSYIMQSVVVLYHVHHCMRGTDLGRGGVLLNVKFLHITHTVGAEISLSSAFVLIGLSALIMNRPSVKTLVRSEQSDHLRRWFKSVSLTLSLYLVVVLSITSPLPFPKMYSFPSSGLYLSPGALLLWCHKSYLEQDEGSRPIWCMDAVKNSLYLLPQPLKSASAASVLSNSSGENTWLQADANAFPSRKRQWERRRSQRSDYHMLLL